MNAFSKAHIWMILPLFVVTAGFYFSYWSVFADVPFHQHLHGLTATAWYLLLVAQPWLYNRKNIALHRKAGFVGLFLAGAVVFSALQVVRNNLANENLQPVLKYGLTWGDLLFLTGFTHAVLMAMWRSDTMAVHARYMIASAVWALLPALARLIYYPLVIGFGYPPPVDFVEVLHLSVALTVITVCILIVLDYRRERVVYASYALAAGGALLFGFSVRYMGEAPWWIDLCNRLLA